LPVIPRNSPEDCAPWLASCSLRWWEALIVGLSMD
jgi:hypothetical protein